MNIVLTTAGMQAIMDAQSGGYKLEIGTFRAYRSTADANSLPALLDKSLLDSGILEDWTPLTPHLDAIDEFHATAPDIFHMVCKIPAEFGDFDLDAVAIYLKNGQLLGAGTYERLILKRKVSDGITANVIELEAFIRFSSVASIMKVTRDNAKRPYSYISEFSKADDLGNALDNMERIYRVTRPTDALGSGYNVFTSFLVHAGIATFDDQNKPYQKAVWVPSDHLALFGSDTLTCKLVTQNTVSIRIPKGKFQMVEHVQPGMQYLIAVTPIGLTEAPTQLRGRIFEATFNVIAESNDYFEIVMLLPNSTFPDTSIHNVDFGVILYASNTDLSAQEAVRVALRKFLEMQYAIGRTYKSDDDTDPNDVLMPYLGYRTYWVKLNGIVEASTSSTDGRLSSAGQIYDLPDYATGGETLLAPVLRATNIWLRYDPSGSGSITYDLSADRISVNEGGSVRYTLRTTGLTNGSKVAYNISGITQDDLASGSVADYFTINNNVGVVDVTLKMDQTTEGVEDMRLYITQDPTIFKTVSVQDTSVTLNVSAFFAVDPAASSGVTQMNEGDTRYFVCVATGILDGTYLYPAILQSSIANVYDLSQSVPSSVRVANGRATFPITVVADKQTEGNEELSIGLFRDAEHTQSLVSASVTVVDTSKAASINAYFSDEVSGGQNISNSVVNEGSYVYLIIETTGYDRNATLGLRYGNTANPSANEVTDADFSTSRPTSVTLDSLGKAVIAYPISNDYAKDRDDLNTLETFNVEILAPGSSLVVARTMVSIRDTSTLEGGSYTITDITDPTAVVVYNSNIDKLAYLNVEESISGVGLESRYDVFGAIVPIDIGLHVGRKYRLTWIQGATASSSVTRVSIQMNKSLVKDFGVGIGTSDLDISDTVAASTVGKSLSMLTGENNVVLGYGAVFEFEVTAARASPVGPTTLSSIIVKAYYPNGIPGATYAPGYAATNWALANMSSIPITEKSSSPTIANLYGGVYEGSPENTFASKVVAIPFGSIVDLLVISPSGSGATSAAAISGSGIDGQNGHTISIRVPKYLGAGALASSQPLSSDGISNDPITISNDMLWDSLIDITGGGKGKAQGYNQARTDLGGVGSTFSYAANKTAILTALAGGKLFARADNSGIEYEVICEVLHSVTGKDYQAGKSTSTDQGGGLGLLPLGSINSPENIRGAGGNGGASVGTGFGYGGGGGSGGMYIIRLGTRILTAGVTASQALGPVSFFISDADAIVAAPTDDIELRTPFNKAVSKNLLGANKGADGSDIYVSQINYIYDAANYFQSESLIGSGSVPMFVRPTHNAAATPTLPLRTQTDWDVDQLFQVGIGKFSIGRVTLLPTGVEGSYTDVNSNVVLGKPSKPTNVLLYSTLAPDETPNETVGSTFVHVASAQADMYGNPVLNTSKLVAMQNTALSSSLVVGGQDATAQGDNTYSRGGFVDLFIANNGTSGKALFVELPRVDISEDNPLKVVDVTPYDPNKSWSNAVDADGNSLSSKGYNLAQGDGALAYQSYVLSNIITIRPWIKMPVKPTSLTDTNAPIILKQGECVTLTVIGGGGTVSSREPVEGVTTSDEAFNGQELKLSIKSLSDDTYTDFLVCAGGFGSIDNTTTPVPSSTVATFDASAIESCLKVVGEPVLVDGTANPIKAMYGGDGSGSYAKVTLMNYYPTPVVIKATGGKGGSGLPDLQVSDGVVQIAVN